MSCTPGRTDRIALRLGEACSTWACTGRIGFDMGLYWSEGRARYQEAPVHPADDPSIHNRMRTRGCRHQVRMQEIRSVMDRTHHTTCMDNIFRNSYLTSRDGLIYTAQCLHALVRGSFMPAIAKLIQLLRHCRLQVSALVFVSPARTCTGISHCYPVSSVLIPARNMAQVRRRLRHHGIVPVRQT